MLGEITMVQLYSVALTAGKAHKNHKHHHAHQYDHSGQMITTPAPTTPRNRPTLPTHPLLTGGQINRNVRINFAGNQPQVIQGQNFDAQYVNGQFVGNLVSQQLSKTQGVEPPILQGLFQPQAPQHVGVSGNPGSFSSQYLSVGNTPLVSSDLNHDLGTVHFVDNSHLELETHSLFKRNNGDESQSDGKKFGDKIVEKDDADSAESKQKKRELYFAGGAIYDDHLVGPGDTQSFDQSLLYGLAGVGQNRIISKQQKQSEDEREPAEAEVKAVLNICDGCDPEPFDKALVFGWRTVPKKLFSGAFFAPAVPKCKSF